jgi:hypothetical protein|mmetsp:Transcript_8627/g.13986  ORF Transcript_8627/g.13986 Transcript_8627/m.13986 type:complete len:317 (-) Transcript_8627:79-1029(-)
MWSFSVISSSTPKVAKTLREFFEDRVLSDFASLELDAEKAYRWHVTGLVFVDLVVLGVEVCVKASDSEINVSVSQTSHNDTIRFNTMFKQMLGFVKARGLQISSHLPRSCLRHELVDDDDFDLSDDEESDWDERVQAVLEDTSSIRAEVREEAFRSIAHLASTTPASHEAIAKGFIERAAELSMLFCTSFQGSVAEKYAFAVALRNMSEGCSLATRDKLLQSQLSAMMDQASKPNVNTIVAREYNRAMKSLGKQVEVSKLIDDTIAVSDKIGSMDYVGKVMHEREHCKGNSENALNSSVSLELHENHDAWSYCTLS